jgi:hypothetical protein
LSPKVLTNVTLAEANGAGIARAMEAATAHRQRGTNLSLCQKDVKQVVVFMLIFPPSQYRQEGVPVQVGEELGARS